MMRSRVKKKQVKRTDALYCPNKKCGEQLEVDLFSGSGNYETECEFCDKKIQFHAEVEFDGVGLVNE